MERPYHYEPSATAEKRLPFRAVVWVFKDDTPDSPGGRSLSQKDGSPLIWSCLTRSESPWRPRLTMEFLSSAMAAEVRARLMQTADVKEGGNGFYPIVDEEAKGARLFVEGTVQKATWTRSRVGGGIYRLTIDLSATVVRTDAPNLERFWTKTVDVIDPQIGHPMESMTWVLRGAFVNAVADLGEALAKGPAAEALAPRSRF